MVDGSTSTQVFQSLGAATNRNGAWTAAGASLNAFAGQTIRIRFEAADACTASLVEAGVDDVRDHAAVTRRRLQPISPVEPAYFLRRGIHG